jgi:23S rRNA (guanosine2251-2'-O)-methyltransferase
MIDKELGERAGDENIIEGRNAVNEALNAGRPIDKVYYNTDSKDGAFKSLVMRIKETGAAAIGCDRKRLDYMSRTGAHQGIIAIVSAQKYSDVPDILARAESSGRPALIVICDEISDPHNLGAVIRSAEAAGAHGVIIPKRRSAGLTAACAKASAGAIEHIPVAKVSNISAAISDLKSGGIWIFGTSLDGETSIYDTDLTVPAAIVIGSEGGGMRRIVSESCDFLMRIPMLGKIQSLNASAAAAVALFEVVRQRR